MPCTFKLFELHKKRVQSSDAASIDESSSMPHTSVSNPCIESPLPVNYRDDKDLEAVPASLLGHLQLARIADHAAPSTNVCQSSNDSSRECPQTEPPRPTPSKNPQSNVKPEVFPGPHSSIVRGNYDLEQNDVIMQSLTEDSADLKLRNDSRQLAGGTHLVSSGPQLNADKPVRHGGDAESATLVATPEYVKETTGHPLGKILKETSRTCFSSVPMSIITHNQPLSVSQAGRSLPVAQVRNVIANSQSTAMIMPSQTEMSKTQSTSLKYTYVQASPNVYAVQPVPTQVRQLLPVAPVPPVMRVPAITTQQNIGLYQIPHVSSASMQVPAVPHKPSLNSGQKVNTINYVPCISIPSASTTSTGTTIVNRGIVMAKKEKMIQPKTRSMIQKVDPRSSRSLASVAQLVSTGSANAAQMVMPSAPEKFNPVQKVTQLVPTKGPSTLPQRHGIPSQGDKLLSQDKPRVIRDIKLHEKKVLNTKRTPIAPSSPTPPKQEDSDIDINLVVDNIFSSSIPMLKLDDSCDDLSKQTQGPEETRPNPDTSLGSLEAMILHLPACIIGSNSCKGTWVVVEDVKEVFFPWCKDPGCSIFREQFENYMLSVCQDKALSSCMTSATPQHQYRFSLSFHYVPVGTPLVLRKLLKANIVGLRRVLLEHHNTWFCRNGGLPCGNEPTHNTIPTLTRLREKIIRVCLTTAADKGGPFFCIVDLVKNLPEIGNLCTMLVKNYASNPNVGVNRCGIRRCIAREGQELMSAMGKSGLINPKEKDWVYLTSHSLLLQHWEHFPHVPEDISRLAASGLLKVHNVVFHGSARAQPTASISKQDGEVEGNKIINWIQEMYKKNLITVALEPSKQTVSNSEVMLRDASPGPKVQDSEMTELGEGLDGTRDGDMSDMFPLSNGLPEKYKDTPLNIGMEQHGLDSRAGNEVSEKGSVGSNDKAYHKKNEGTQIVQGEGVDPRPYTDPLSEQVQSVLNDMKKKSTGHPIADHGFSKLAQSQVRKSTTVGHSKNTLPNRSGIPDSVRYKAATSDPNKTCTGKNSDLLVCSGSGRAASMGEDHISIKEQKIRSQFKISQETRSILKPLGKSVEADQNITKVGDIRQETHASAPRGESQVDKSENMKCEVPQPNQSKCLSEDSRNEGRKDIKLDQPGVSSLHSDVSEPSLSNCVGDFIAVQNGSKKKSPNHEFATGVVSKIRDEHESSNGPSCSKLFIDRKDSELRIVIRNLRTIKSGTNTKRKRMCGRQSASKKKKTSPTGRHAHRRRKSSESHVSSSPENASAIGISHEPCRVVKTEEHGVEAKVPNAAKPKNILQQCMDEKSVSDIEKHAQQTLAGKLLVEFGTAEGNPLETKADAGQEPGKVAPVEQGSLDKLRPAPEALDIAWDPDSESLIDVAENVTSSIRSLMWPPSDESKVYTELDIPCAEAEICVEELACSTNEGSSEQPKTKSKKSGHRVKGRVSKNSQKVCQTQDSGKENIFSDNISALMDDLEHQVVTPCYYTAKIEHALPIKKAIQTREKLRSGDPEAVIRASKHICTCWKSPLKSTNTLPPKKMFSLRSKEARHCQIHGDLKNLVKEKVHDVFYACMERIDRNQSDGDGLRLQGRNGYHLVHKKKAWLLQAQGVNYNYATMEAGDFLENYKHPYDWEVLQKRDIRIGRTRDLENENRKTETVESDECSGLNLKKGEKETQEVIWNIAKERFRMKAKEVASKEPGEMSAATQRDRHENKADGDATKQVPTEQEDRNEICMTFPYIRPGEDTHMSGTVKAGTALFPYVLRNGYKHIAARDVISFFRGCENRCFIVKKLASKTKDLQPTMCTFEEVTYMEELFPRMHVSSGDVMIRLDLLNDYLPILRERVKIEHEKSTSKFSKKCTSDL